MQATVMVVDDQASVRQLLSRTLADSGYEIVDVGTGQEALRAFSEAVPEVVILDLKLPDTDGLKVLGRMKELSRSTAVIMVTAYGEVKTAVQAMQLGAFDFLQKPVDMEQMLLVVRKAIESQRLWMELSHWRRQQKRRAAVNFIMGPSPRMKEVYLLVEQLARSNTTSVLIQGESGTGKEHIAQVIHCLSPRKDSPFLEVNCASLPEELLESELFGHERGAFTDAHAQKKGLLEMADGGTLFLDEVGEMSGRIQAKLLRVLERMSFRRVGGTRDIRVDVRIISATNRNLEEAVAEGSFREDLYYRLKVVPVYVPPLRERLEDMLLLAKHFIHQFNKAFGKDFQHISPEAAARLAGYQWPGNVREMKNVIERTVLLSEGRTIEAHHLPLGPEPAVVRSQLVTRLEQSLRLPIPLDGIDLEGLVHDFEKELVVKALGQANWNQTQAARLLGMNRDKLRYRVKSFSLEREGVPVLVS